MPSQNSNVQFCYINQNLPDTYNDNTIYFDEINGSIQVGETEIANKSYLLKISKFGNNLVGELNNQSLGIITTDDIGNLEVQYRNTLSIVYEYWDDSLKVIVPLVSKILTDYNFSTTYYNANYNTTYLITIQIQYDTFIENRIELSHAKQELILTITDNNDIIHIPGNQVLNNINLNGVAWSAWRAAITDPNVYNNYILKVIWAPDNSSIQSEQPILILTDYEINSYELSFIFKTTLFNGKMLEIIISPFLNNTGLVTATTLGKLILEYNTNGNLFPSTTSSPTFFTAPIITTTWQNIVDNKNNLELQIKDNNSQQMIKCNNYCIDILDNNTTSTMYFGPIQAGRDQYYARLMASSQNNIFDTTVTSCEIFKY